MTKIIISWLTFVFSGFQEYFFALELQMEEKTLVKVTLEGHWFSKVLILKIISTIGSGKSKEIV